MKLINIVFVTIILLVRGSYAQDVSVCTYNIRLDTERDGENSWIHRRDFLASQLLTYSPGVIGLQEALPNQVEFLKTKLLSYHAFGDGREGGSNGESTPIFYDTTQYRVSATGTFWLSPTPNVISKGWDAAYLRICTYGLFTQKNTLKGFWVFNTHLDHIGEVSRKKSVDLILEKIHEVNNAGLPVVLMGDFNSTPKNELILELKVKMSDAREISDGMPIEEEGTFNGFDFEALVRDRIDYVFLSKIPKWTVEKYVVINESKNKKFPSDHFPVFVLISL